MTQLKLTYLGDIVNRNSVITPIQFWKDIVVEVNRLMDVDGDLEYMMAELRVGLKELCIFIMKHGIDALELPIGTLESVTYD
jgi:hypothetical protein